MCIRDRGVNILYLALGVLRWYEADAAQQPRRAPLYLLPVELERGSALDRFHLRASGDDPGENLSLAEKLRTEFMLMPRPSRMPGRTSLISTATSTPGRTRFAACRAGRSSVT